MIQEKEQSIFKLIRDSKNFSQKRSLDWFKDKVKLLGGRDYNPADRRLFTENQDKLRSQIYPGSLYFYGYDPKFKETLPYYDKFPLTFVFDVTSTHFMGINFHYLPLNIRFALWDKMYKFRVNTGIDEKKKINLNWSLLKAATVFPEVKPSVKQYLLSHVQTRFMKIDLDDMKSAMLLPVESFAKKSPLVVRQYSMAQIRAISPKHRIRK